MMFKVFRRNNVLPVIVIGENTKDACIRMVNSAVRYIHDGIVEAVTDTILLKMHQRLGHLTYDAVERMDKSVGL